MDVGLGQGSLKAALWLSAAPCCPASGLPSDRPARSHPPASQASHPRIFSFKKSWGCGLESRSHEKAAYEVLREEYRKLGPVSFAEASVLLCFLALVGLWFSRDPGFMPGWGSLAWEEGKTK